MPSRPPTGPPTSSSFTWQEGPGPPSAGLSEAGGGVELDGKVSDSPIIGWCYTPQHEGQSREESALLPKEITPKLEGDQYPEPGFNSN